MIQGKWFAPGEALSSDLLRVYQSVFGRSAGEADPDAWNALVYLDDQPAAAGRIWWQDGAFWLGDIGVIPALRGQRLGDLVLRLLLFKAQSHAAREIRLRCPEETEGFFARLGFQQDSLESGTAEMMVAGENVSLDSCASCPKQDCAGHR